MFINSKSTLSWIIGSLLTIIILLVGCEVWAEYHFKPIEFTPNLQKIITNSKPDIICIGNSMLGSNVIRNQFQRELSNLFNKKITAQFITSGGLHSAWQYLVVKNQVIPSSLAGVPIVLIDYEDYFTRPDAATYASGVSEIKYKKNMLKEEPVFNKKIGNNSIYYKNGFPYLFSQRYKIKKHFTSKLLRTFLDLSGVSSLIDSRRYKPHNEIAIEWLFGTLFKGSNFKNGQVDDKERIDRELFSGSTQDEFNYIADKSFLPDILEYSKDHPIIFVESNSNPSMFQIKKSLPKYSEQLETYISNHNGIYIDLNREDALQVPSLMHDSRHYFAGRPKELNTKILAKKIYDSLQLIAKP